MEGIHEAHCPLGPLAAGFQLCPQPLSTHVHWPLTPGLAPEAFPGFKAVRLLRGLEGEPPALGQSRRKVGTETTGVSQAPQNLSHISSLPHLLCIPLLPSPCPRPLAKPSPLLVTSFVHHYLKVFPQTVHI